MRNQKPITLTESRLRQIIKEELSAARRDRRARSLSEGLDLQTEEEWQDFLDQQRDHAPGAVYSKYVRDYQAWKKSQGLPKPRSSATVDFQTEEEWQDFLDQQLNHAPGAVYAGYVRDYQAWKKSQGLVESRPTIMGQGGSPELKVDRKGMEADARTMQKLEDFCRDYPDLCGSFGTAAVEAALQLTLGYLDARSLLADMDLESGEFAHVVAGGEAGVKDWADSIVSNLAEYSRTKDLLVVGVPSRIKSIGLDLGPFDRGHVSIRDIASGAATF